MPAQVWAVLTDYDRLVEFVPNLEACEKLPGGTKTRHALFHQDFSASYRWSLQVLCGARSAPHC